MAKKGTMTENSHKVFDFLKANGAGVKFTTRDVMTALGFEKPGTVTGSINGLYKKGYVDKTKEMREDAEGKAKEVSVFWLTDAGASFDPDAVVEDAE